VFALDTAEMDRLRVGLEHAAASIELARSAESAALGSIDAAHPPTGFIQLVPANFNDNTAADWIARREMVIEEAFEATTAFVLEAAKAMAAVDEIKALKVELSATRLRTEAIQAEMAVAEAARKQAAETEAQAQRE